MDFSDGAQLGLALGPGEADNQLIAVTEAGEMKYIDFRMTTGQTSASVAGEGFPPLNSSSARMGVWKTVAPDDKGPLCAVAAHPYAPLLATSSLTPQSQVQAPFERPLMPHPLCPLQKTSTHTFHAGHPRL